MPTLQGFLRSDGRKGIRNYIVVAYLVERAHHVALEIVGSPDGKYIYAAVADPDADIVLLDGLLP